MPWGQFFTYLGQFLIVAVIAFIIAGIVIAAVKEVRK